MAQGSNAAVGYGFETVAPMQRAASFYGLRTAGFTFNPDVKTERTRNMQARPMNLKASVNEVALPWSVDWDPSVDDITRLLWHINGYAAITNPSASVYEWAIRDLLAGDVQASDPSTMSIDAWRDDSWGTLLLGAAAKEVEFKVQRNKLVQSKISGTALRFTHMKNATMLVNGATYTGSLHIRGNRLDADGADIVNHLKLKVYTAGALNGTAVVRGTRGVTAYAVSGGQAVTAGVWYPFLLADGTNASGNPYNPIEFMLTSGGTLSLNDEFEIQAQRPAPTLSYPSRQPLSGNGLTVTIGGVIYTVENFDIKFTRPRKEQRGAGSMYASSHLPDGNRQFSISIQRDYVTKSLYDKMISGAALAFDATLLGDYISGSYQEMAKFASVNAQVFKAGANPTSDKQLQESAEIVPYYDGTNPDMTITMRNTLATLT